MASRTVALIRLVVIVTLPFLAGCTGWGDYNSQAALLMMSGGLTNYGAQRASYQAPVYNSTYCYRVGNGMLCN